jgi:predicted AlkP superfamily phosphohydrolase/phosphomutase
LTLLFADRDHRISCRWGVVWGAMLGSWLAAPALLNVHQLRPSTFSQWAIVDGFLWISFAALGAALAPIAALPFTAYRISRQPRVANRQWTYAIWTLALMPTAYLALSAILEIVTFSKPSAAAGYGAALRSATLALLVPVAVLALAYTRLVRSGWDARGRVLAWAAATATLCGFAALPGRLTASEPLPVKSLPLTARQPASKPAPLFVLCLDGANWRTLRAVMERGEAPTFSRIASSGLQGLVEAPWPPYWSNPAWAAIFTGYTNDEVGVHEDLAGTAPGLPTFEVSLSVNPVLNPLLAEEFVLSKIGIIRPMLAPRTVLKRPPVWERLSHAGVRTAVIRLPFTYPAPGQADYVFSNWLVPDLWQMANVQAGERDKLVFPPSLTGDVLANFSDKNSPDASVLSRLLPRQDWPQPADSIVDPVQVLKTITSNTFREARMTTRLLKSDRGLSVVMLYMPGIDLLSHAFWQYRFPEDFPNGPPAPADVAQLGPVLDRYISWLDSEVGRMIASFQDPPNVLIVSDHGEGPTEMATLWKGWHASPGVFMAAGPGIPYNPDILRVSYYDIVPTILDLESFDKPADLGGHSLVRRSSAPDDSSR